MLEVKEQLKKYHQLAQVVHKIDVKVLGNSDEFNELIEMEEAVLKSYGLPVGEPFQSIIEFFGLEEAAEEKDINQLLKELSNAATQFHLSDAATNEQILIWGKNNYKPFDYVLPLAGFERTCYNIFLYTELWVRKNYPVKEIIAEMQKANKFNKEVNIASADEKRPAQAAKILKAAGAKYADEFKKYRNKERLPKAIVKSIDKEYNWLFGAFFPQEKIEFETFYIESFYINEDISEGDLERDVSVILYFMNDKEWQRIALVLQLSKFQEMLRHCRQTDLAELINSYCNAALDFPQIQQDWINIRHSYKTYLECDKLLCAKLVDTDFINEYILLA